MQLREYQPSDCAQMAELFYQTVHSVNAKNYTKEQLDAWTIGEVDLQAWDKSFRAHKTICETNLQITKRRTADRPPSISLRLPCPEHLNLRFVRVLVDAFRMHDKLLALIKRKRPLIFLIDAQGQARFARLCIL